MLSTISFLFFLKKIFTYDDSSYFYQINNIENIFKIVKQNIISIIHEISLFLFTSNNIEYLFLSFLLLFSSLYFYLFNIVKKPFISVYYILYLMVFLIWPHASFRFYYIIIFIIILAIIEIIGKTKLFAFYLLIVFIFNIYLNYTNLSNIKKRDSPLCNECIQCWRFINNLANESTVIAFYKPRALHYFTNVSSYILPGLLNENKLLNILNENNTSYILIDLLCDDYQESAEFVSFFSNNLKLQWSNERFILFQYNK
jgi:hypothetical protein